MAKNLDLIKSKILESRSIVVAGHINPDGDSIGSLLSLGLGLKKLGKTVYMISTDGVPKRYRLLPGASKIRKSTDKTVDLAISVDCGNKKMLGKAFEIFEKAKTILEIDHHLFRQSFGDLLFNDVDAAAAGELVYRLLNELEVPLCKDIAQNLLTSIVVETNSFSLPKVSPLTFDICAKLMALGVDYYKLVDAVFWSEKKEATILTGLCLSRCKFLKRGKLVWSIVRRRDFGNVKGKDEDVDAVCDRMRAIKDVEMAILFREKSKKILRVSLRSKHKINIAIVAEHFGGGGHFDVAGCFVPNTKKSIEDLLEFSKSLLTKDKNIHEKT